MSQALTRRALLKTAAVGAATAVFPHRTVAQTSPKVVVVGGGFGGATCARELKRKGLTVTLVEASAVYTACPFSNAVLAGLRPIEAQEFKLDAVEKDRIDIVRKRAVRVDPQARRWTTIALSFLQGSISGSTPCPAMTGRQPRLCRMPGRRESRRPSCAASSKPWMMAVPLS